MISPPFIQVQCDQTAPGSRDRCRTSEVLTLPGFGYAGSREAAAALFMAVNREWWIDDAGKVFCPQCHRVAVLQALEKRQQGAAV